MVKTRGRDGRVTHVMRPFRSPFRRSSDLGSCTDASHPPFGSHVSYGRAARRLSRRRLSEMKWEKAGAEEYGFPPASAVVSQRASGRLRIWASLAERRHRGPKAGPKAGPKRNWEPPGPKSRHAETSPGRTGPLPESHPGAFRPQPRRAGVVRAQADAAVAEHREARRRCPRAW